MRTIPNILTFGVPIREYPFSFVFRQFAMSDKKRRRPAEPVPKRKKRKVLDEDGNEVKQVPITQEMAREADDTIVAPDDHEVRSNLFPFLPLDDRLTKRTKGF